MNARVALVTGAGQRVGRVIAETLAARGWRIVVHHFGSGAGAQEVVQGIVARGGAAMALRADLRDPIAVATLAREAHAAFGQLDLLVNSAGGMERTTFGSITAEDFDAIVALNLRAPFFWRRRSPR